MENIDTLLTLAKSTLIANPNPAISLEKIEGGGFDIIHSAAKGNETKMSLRSDPEGLTDVIVQEVYEEGEHAQRQGRPDSRTGLKNAPVLAAINRVLDTPSTEPLSTTIIIGTIDTHGVRVAKFLGQSPKKFSGPIVIAPHATPRLA